MNSDSDNFPPRLLLRLLRWFCHPDLLPYIEGDLIELFEERVRERGGKKARWLFAWDVVKLFRPGLIRPLGGHYQLNSYGMVRNHIKIAFRIFRREKFFTAINIVGLTCGIWCALMTALWVQDELRYDQFHEKGNQLYRVLMNINLDGEIYTEEGTAYPVGDVMVEDIPGIEERVRYSYPEPVALTVNNKLTEQELASADPNFFEVFSVPLVQGNPKSCLQELNSVVISDRMARSFFGEQSPIGEIITVHEGEYSLDFTVSGIFESFPRHSTMRFDLVIPIDNLKQIYGEMDSWGNTWFATYLVLNEGADVEKINRKIKDLPKDKAEIESFTFMLQKYNDQYLYGRFENGALAGGRIDYVVLFVVIAVFTVLIGCFNYVNLTTARSMKRTREIGVRKVIGATRGTLLAQFLTESALIVFFSVAIAVLFAYLSLPLFNAITFKEIQFEYFNLNFYLLLAAVALFTLIFSGLYPSAVLSSFLAPNALKGQIRNLGFQNFLRKGIVTFQFCLTVMLVSGAFVVFLQLKYLLEKDLGLEKENVIFLELDQNSQPKYQQIKSALEGHSGILSVSGSSHDFIGPAIGFTSDPEWRGKSANDNQVKFFGIQDIDYGLLDMLNIKLLAGRAFSEDVKSDSTNYIINQAAARAMGFDDPLGETLSFWGGSGKIIGVVEDFHFATLHETIKPIIIRRIPNEKFVFIKTAPGKTPDAIAHIERVHESFSALPSKYHFMDHVLEESYRSEMSLQKLAGYFSLLAIVISCLGLLGLVSYNLERRTKEIAIRKVLGARVASLMRLLFNEYFTLILLAVVIGIPVSIYIMKQWLEGFAYRVELSLLMFFIPCGVLLVITGAIVILQSAKLHRLNPSDSLRNE